MNLPLWQPTDEKIKTANITSFIELVNETYHLHIKNYQELYTWSIDNMAMFWSTMWEFGQIIASKPYDKVFDNISSFRPDVSWFPGSKLNFAENLLRYRNNNIALLSLSEDQKIKQISYKMLYAMVARVVKSLKKLNIEPGDRIVAYMPNIIETVIAMLATTSIGAIWSSCGAELGTNAVIDRFGQVEPKVLFTANGYWYKGKEISNIENIKSIAKAIPSLKQVIIVANNTKAIPLSDIPSGILFEDFLSNESFSNIEFEQLPFDHPVYIMFSSGTTGKPKCMAQSAGGVLINHLKELILHTDLKQTDKILYITSCSWMMWNWLVSSLAVGATAVLYDGNPSYPDWTAMWKIIETEEITIFGCSATYINFLRTIDASPNKRFNLSKLREISQTGSSLSAEGFVYVYKKIKQDLHFNSISGGTDINGCFAIGNPTLPVYAGELQAPGLAMKIKAYDDKGNAVVDQQGELVCEVATPSMPIYFWNDKNYEKYLNAYFNYYTTKKIWRHGDFIEINSKTGGITIYGRSDAVLKPSGVRIGTAEIYGVVEQITGVVDSLVIGQEWKNDQRLILFVKLAEGYTLTNELKEKIKTSLKEQASPRHVPQIIMETPDIPYTFSNKKVELAVMNIIHDKPVTNKDAISNPQSLEFYEKIVPELRKE